MWMSPLNGKEKEKRMKGNWNETLQWKKKMKGKGNETLVWNIIDDWWKWTSHCYMDLWFVRLMCCMKWWKYYMSRSLYFLLFDHRHICTIPLLSLFHWNWVILSYLRFYHCIFRQGNNLFQSYSSCNLFQRSIFFTNSR